MWLSENFDCELPFVPTNDFLIPHHEKSKQIYRSGSVLAKDYNRVCGPFKPLVTYKTVKYTIFF